MFRKYSLFILIAIISLFTAFFVILTQINSTDRKTYQNLMDSSTAALDKEKVGSYKAKQHRKGVSKHYIFCNGPERLNMLLKGLESDLFFHQKGDKTEIIEHFKNVQCISQETFTYSLLDGRQVLLNEKGNFFVKNDNLEHNDILEKGDPRIQSTQTVRTLKASKAIYHYGTENLLADDVQLSRYLAKGVILNDTIKPTQELMSGTASEIELSFSGGDKPYKAKGLQAKFHDLGKQP